MSAPLIHSERADVYKVPVSMIRVDDRYQRSLSTARISQYAKKFDPELLGVVELSMRDDNQVFVIDGQHRVALVRKVLGEELASLLSSMSI